MKLPSERVKEIFGDDKASLTEIPTVISAILQYLDEVYLAEEQAREELKSKLKPME